ncbi:MAG: proline dehydrogenase family protein, partial [Cyclobacteriaceae bacterium]|nr:proline dehydrogenase family protein [Cyclobacteriaceae bacterium]
IKNNLFLHFCGGESISDSESTILSLAKYNIGTILDYAVEGENTEEAFDHTAAEIIRTIDRSANDPNIPFCVFKPTGMASIDLLEKVQPGKKLTKEETLSFERIKNRWDRVCGESFNHDERIFIDSEDSYIQDPIDMIIYELMERYNREKAIVWNTYQMYRVGMLDNLEKAIEKARRKEYFFGAKLVRGAYMEKERERAEVMGYPDPIQPDKNATDSAYDTGLELCIKNRDIVSVCSGSHNERSNYYLTELMADAGMLPGDERVYFAQLYGMSDHISFNLAKAGYNVVKYVPYGPVDAVIPYLLRRAEENTSISGQSSREFTLIQKELRRRKAGRKKSQIT